MGSHMRHLSFMDKIIGSANDALSTIFTVPAQARCNPADAYSDVVLTPEEQRISVGCMRVNHTGEVCAQALYRGQALTSRSDATRLMLEKSCEEETDHLEWTKSRLVELHGKTSYLNVFFYLHAFLIGVIAGIMGDRWSLGFVSETETQVASHLQNHLEKLPIADLKSRAIVSQMQIEELDHEKKAVDAGAATLPFVIKKLMQLHSKVMTMTTYFI